MAEEKELNFDDFLLEPINPYAEDLEEKGEQEEKPEEEEEEVKEEDKKEEKKEEGSSDDKLDGLSEEVQDLYKKAEEDMDSLTEDEVKILEENNLLDEEDNTDGGDASVLPLIELMHENAGWEYDESKFKDTDTVEGLMDFVGEVIEANSKPEFASDEVAKFNEFVSKYGAEKAADYLDVNYGNTDYESLDTSSEDVQKQIYTDYLKRTTKFSDTKITKEVKKLADLDELEGEVGDAKEYLIADDKKAKEDFEKVQEQAAVSQQENFKKYLGTQKERIESAKEIAGFELNEKDKEGLYKFAFETDRSGKTAYQKLKETDKDLDLKLLLLAYKGVDKAKITKEATTATTKKLKKSLSRFKDNKSGGGSGTATPKKQNPNSDINYNDFILR